MQKNVLKLVLNVSVICLVSSCQPFEWEPKPWQPSYELESIISAEGDEVLCSDPFIETFTCFDESNMAALGAAIRKVQNKKVKKELQNIYRRMRHENNY